MKFTKRTARRNACMAVIAAGLAVLAAGCQTTVPVSYTEPARLNMGGISKIGIISDNREATAAVSAKLQGTGKYTVLTDGAEIEELERWQKQQSLLNGATEISASDLIKAYTSNAARAKQNYGAKILKVSGVVSEIQENAIRLDVGNDSVDVYIEKSETGKAASLEKGAKVVMVGTCYGFDSPDSTDTAEILRILGGGKHINIANATFYVPEYVGTIDAVLALKTSSSVNEESKLEKRAATNADGETLKDDDGNVIYRNVETYRRTAAVNIAYEAIRPNGTSIGSGDASGSANTAYVEDKSKLTASSTLISTAMKKPLEKIISDMVPTEHTLSVKLAQSDNKDKEFKAAMNAAKKLVSAKDYLNAAAEYGKLYEKTKDFAAGYNQAVLTEVAQGTDKALVLMEELAKNSGNPQAQSMLTEMQKRDKANKQSAEQMKK